MYRNFLGIFAVFAVALLLVAFTFSASTEGQADFRFVNGAEPKSLDPHIMTGQVEGRIADAIFEGLMFRDPRTLRPVPGVAREMPEISADRKTYVFCLRPEARWSDGTPITAHDFAWSWRRLQEPSLGSEYAYILHMVRWAEVFNTYRGNAKTLRTKVVPGLEDLLAGGEDVRGTGWQDFLVESGAPEALKNVSDAVLQDALAFREGVMDRGRLEVILDHLRAEGDRRERLHRYADAHFGVDEGVFARDDETLVVELNAPTPYFLDIVSFYSALPVPRHVVGEEENKEDWFLPDKIVSNGPYRLESWHVHDRIRLVRNEAYWNVANTKLGTIDAFSTDKAPTALNLYLTGAVDWIPNYPRDLVDVVRKRRDFYCNPGMVVYYYRFNTTVPPFDDPRVRQAICLAIDRKDIVENVRRLGELPAYGLVPPGLAGYEPPPTEVRFDKEEARRLLAEAGYPGGKGWPENVGLLFNTSDDHRKLAEVVADQLRRNLGIHVKAYNQEWQAYQASVLKMDYYMARAGWIGDYLDPNTFLDMWVTNGGNNQTGWGSPLYDRLIRTAADVEVLLAESESLFEKLKEPDVAGRCLEAMRTARTEEERLDAGARLRMHLFREAEAILFQEAFPICPVYFYVVSGLVRPSVRGFYSKLEFDDGTTADNLQDIHPLRGLWIEKEEAR